MNHRRQRIPEFFAGKNVFITGATGFMGKALIEKLLRSCPKIGIIYCVMRPKRGKSMLERLQQLTNDPLYERLKKEQPDLDMTKKIVAFEGNLSDLNIGLSEENRRILIENVHVIFHVAASVRFDDSLTDALILNVRGSREVCQLALECKHVLAYIHVSTAFANCDRTEAHEELYPTGVDWRNTILVAEKLDKYMVDVLTEKYMDGMPNTYCFTKKVAEHVVNDMLQGKIPTKIFRPSIVISSMMEEPVSGWIDNFNGPVGLLIAYGKGIMRTTYCHPHYKPDYIPIDVATKALIVCAWDLASRQQKNTVEIVQCTSHNVADWLRPTVEILGKTALEVNRDVPLNDILWYPSSHWSTNRVMWYVRTIFTMVLPSLLLDGVLRITGNKPILFKLQRKMFNAQLALRHFMTHEWIYSNENLLALRKTIPVDDIPDWDYDFFKNDFKTYARNSIIGCRRYLLKEPDHTLPKARKHYRRMYWIDTLVKFIWYSLLIWLIWRTELIQTSLGRLENFGSGLIRIK